MKTLNDIIGTYAQERFATTAGTQMHNRLRRVVIDGDNTTGDSELVAQILAHPELVPFFSSASRCEVPIAGILNNEFISRRLDRLLIDEVARTIRVLDYKTDTDTHRFYTKYIAQIQEYISLLKMIYSDYDIQGYILWTHDFSLEKVPVKQL